MRWDLLDLDNAILSIRTSIGQDGAKTWEKDTKTLWGSRSRSPTVCSGFMRTVRTR
jgi:hypothetical protein